MSVPTLFWMLSCQNSAFDWFGNEMDPISLYQFGVVFIVSFGQDSQDVLSMYEKGRSAMLSAFAKYDINGATDMANLPSSAKRKLLVSAPWLQLAFEQICVMKTSAGDVLVTDAIKDCLPSQESTPAK